MPTTLDGLYFIRFIELDDDTTNVSIGQFINFISPNFLLIQPYKHTDEDGCTPIDAMKIIGIPNFENCLVFKTLEEAVEEFEFAIADDEEDDCE